MNASHHTSSQFLKLIIALGCLSLPAFAGERELAVANERAVGNANPMVHELTKPELLERAVPGELDLAPSEPREPAPRAKLFDVDLELAAEGELLIRVTALEDKKPILWVSDNLKDWEPLAMGQAGAEPNYLFLVQSSAQEKKFFRVTPPQALEREAVLVELEEAGDDGDSGGIKLQPEKVSSLLEILKGEDDEDGSTEEGRGAVRE